MFPSVKDGSFSMPLQTPYTDFFNASGIIMYTKLRHPTLNGAVFPGDILYADETIAKAVIGFWCGNSGNPVLSVVGSFQLDCDALKLINTQYITIDDLLDNLKGLEDCKGEFNRKMFSGDASKQLYECSQVFMENLNDPHHLEMFNIAENDSGLYY